MTILVSYIIMIIIIIIILLLLIIRRRRRDAQAGVFALRDPPRPARQGGLARMHPRARATGGVVQEGERASSLCRELLPVSMKKTSVLRETWPCNPVGKIALQPLIRCFSY